MSGCESMSQTQTNNSTFALGPRRLLGRRQPWRPPLAFILLCHRGHVWTTAGNEIKIHGLILNEEGFRCSGTTLSPHCPAGMRHTSINQGYDIIIWSIGTAVSYMHMGMRACAQKWVCMYRRCQNEFYYSSRLNSLTYWKWARAIMQRGLFNWAQIEHIGCWRARADISHLCAAVITK